MEWSPLMHLFSLLCLAFHIKVWYITYSLKFQCKHVIIYCKQSTYMLIACKIKKTTRFIVLFYNSHLIYILIVILGPGFMLLWINQSAIRCNIIIFTWEYRMFYCAKSQKPETPHLETNNNTMVVTPYGHKQSNTSKCCCGAPRHLNPHLWDAEIRVFYWRLFTNHAFIQCVISCPW